jgi:hypothetical protein
MLQLRSTLVGSSDWDGGDGGPDGEWDKVGRRPKGAPCDGLGRNPRHRLRDRLGGGLCSLLCLSHKCRLGLDHYRFRSDPYDGLLDGGGGGGRDRLRLALRLHCRTGHGSNGGSVQGEQTRTIYGAVSVRLQVVLV